MSDNKIKLSIPNQEPQFDTRICIPVRYKQLHPNAKMPIYTTNGAGAADLFVCLPDDVQQVTIAPHDSVEFSTGFAVEIPFGFVGFIFARSGLSNNRGLAPADKVAVIDSDYRGDLKIRLYNHSNVPQNIYPGERIAQFLITTAFQIRFVPSETLSETTRGNRGFGSTGMTTSDLADYRK